jgi:NADPH-dependent 2,4-dienoyl-CoA reductase/sulfur reductase-like enzyme
MPETLAVQPYDVHNRLLVSNVHPPDWDNPEPVGRYNLVVLGAGTAGLVSAAGAAGLGARVALVEREFMGGDCLNVGCVPSKALIAAARVAATVRNAGEYGVEVPPGTRVDFAAVMKRMRRLRASLSPTDSAARFRGLGVDVFLGPGKFTGPDTVEVAGKTTLRFRQAVIATGARASTLPIPGLADAGYLTNETVFSLTELPRRLTVIGAGPIGCELAQAFARFGSEVTVLQRAPQVLPEGRPRSRRLGRAVPGPRRHSIRLRLQYSGCPAAKRRPGAANRIARPEERGARRRHPGRRRPDAERGGPEPGSSRRKLRRETGRPR